MNTVKIMGYDVFGLKLSDINISESKQVINTINAYSYVLAQKDDSFKDALKNSDILLPDGFPIVLASKLLTGKTIDKIAGEDVFIHLMKIANEQGKKVFFLGSSNTTLSLINNKAKVQYPNIRIGSFSPPYKPVFSAQDNSEMIEAVTKFAPDILFVGMTAPKQEKWVNANCCNFDVKIICSIGAVFDFYAETIKRPSKFWINLNLEWFVRFINEPKRLFARYFYYSPSFFFDLGKAWFRK